MKRLLVAAVFSALVGAPQSSSAQLFVDYSVSGASGAWLLDFAVTSNYPLTINQYYYFFGIALDGAAVASTPAEWSPYRAVSPGGYEGGSNTVYNANWIAYENAGRIAPGASLAGFVASVNSVEAPTSVDYFAVSWGSDAIDGDFNDGINPGFERVAYQRVPEPTSLMLMLSGVLGLAVVAYRRKEETLS